MVDLPHPFGPVIIIFAAFSPPQSIEFSTIVSSKTSGNQTLSKTIFGDSHSTQSTKQNGCSLS